LSLIDKPENLQFGADKTTVCQNDVVTFTCSADGNPVVHIYQFYENDTLVHNSSSGVWRRTMSTGGMFIYKCVANNTVGTASSMNVHVTVNGKEKLMLHSLKILRLQTVNVGAGGTINLSLLRVIAFYSSNALIIKFSLIITKQPCFGNM